MRFLLSVSALALLLSSSAFADSTTGLRCLRSFNQQPALASEKVDGKDYRDVVLPATRNGKGGIYYFSGDDRGAGALFIPLSKQELELKDYNIAFVNPVTLRKVYLKSTGVDLDNHTALETNSVNPNQEMRVVDSKSIELAQDRATAEVVDESIANLVPDRAKYFTDSPEALALRSPKLVQSMPQIGLNDPAVKKIYDDEKQAGAAKIADAYVKSADKMLDFSDSMLSALQAHLNLYCVDKEKGPIGVKAKASIQATLDKVKSTLEQNKKIRPKLAEGLADTLPGALRDAKPKTFANVGNLQNFIAGHITMRVWTMRKEADGVDPFEDRRPHRKPMVEGNPPPSDSSEESFGYSEPVHD